MKIIAAEFVTSADARARGVPRDALAQVAFVGRSNVGKSTLLNALARRQIARTSATPGKTRLANIFRIAAEGGPGGPGRWAVYFVDLPGYGYARGGESAAAELDDVARAYFGQRGPHERGAGPPDAAPRRLTLLLVDSRHPGLDADVQAHAWLAGVAPVVVVATKIDKLSRAERVRNLKAFEKTFGTAALPVSAASGEGLEELWKTIAKLARNP